MRIYATSIRAMLRGEPLAEIDVYRAELADLLARVRWIADDIQAAEDKAGEEVFVPSGEITRRLYGLVGRWPHERGEQ